MAKIDLECLCQELKRTIHKTNQDDWDLKYIRLLQQMIVEALRYNANQVCDAQS